MNQFHLHRMEDLPTAFTVEIAASSARDSASTLAPISIRTEDGLRVWTSILGPSSILLARILLEEPGRRWHVADLAGQLGLAVGYTQRCIKRLDRFGWITATNTGDEFTYYITEAAVVGHHQLERLHPELAARYARHCGLVDEHS